MPDGSIVVGDKPAPGAKEVKQIPLRQGNIVAPLTPPARGEGANPIARPRQTEADIDDEIRTAQEELQSAKSELATKRDPLPGERIGTAGGGSRTTDAYAIRLKALEDNIAAAQKRLDDAYSKRRGP